MRNQTAVTKQGKTRVGSTAQWVSQRGVALVAVLALVACGGGDGDEAAEAPGATVAEAGAPEAVGADVPGAPDDGLTIPDWWPSDVALPTGLVLDSAAEDLGGAAALDLGGSVQGADVDIVAGEQVAALEAAGFEQIAVDDGSGTVRASRPGLGDVQFRFTQRGDDVSVTAVLRRAADAAPADVDAGGEITGDGPGTALVLLGGVQYVSEGRCIDWSFSGALDQGGAVVNVAAGLDATTGTQLEYMGPASVMLPDGATWWADEQVDFQATETGYGVYGTASELSAAEGTSAPLQITVECRP